MSFNPDISPLVSPLSGASACGESLRYTEVYDKIREARREEDERLPQGVWKTEIKKANWEQVKDLCEKALVSQTKDLQIALWLTEAWLHLYGIAGLEHGLEVILGLTRRYWKDLHPLTGGRCELRIGLYEWLNGRLSEDIKGIPMTLPTADETTVCTLLELSKGESAEDSGFENEISVKINQTPLTYYQQMEKGWTRALKTTLSLEKALHTYLGDEAPTLSRLKKRLEDVQRSVHQILQTKVVKKAKKTMKKPVKASSPAHKEGGRGTIKNREQAYAILEEVAAYLEAVEPHSPTPYLIRRAIAWGHMKLPQVISTVLSKDGDLSSLLDILNIKQEPSDASGG